MSSKVLYEAAVLHNMLREKMSRLALLKNKREQKEKHIINNDNIISNCICNCSEILLNF